jgi:NAD+ synthase (glutamine-hydrolysing)
VRKNGFRSVILALSGGIDSALTATIATDAIGPGNVHVVLMPSRYSSEHSVTDAEELVKRQGVQAVTIPIASVVDAFSEELTPAGFPDTGLPAENLQARVRGVVLMGLSNAGGHLVLTTGNKSELATGYSTLYGDSAGGFGPIKDVFKTLVWELARWRNAEAERQGATPPIPENSITKPPSAELAPGQMDTDSLPAYEVLDKLLDDYVEKDMGTADLVAAGHDPELVERVVRLVDAAEYKRRQYPPGPKITQKNFGRDRRLPITNRWREALPGPSDAHVERGGARPDLVLAADGLTGTDVEEVELGGVDRQLERVSHPDLVLGIYPGHELVAPLAGPLLEPVGLVLAEVGGQLADLVRDDRRRVDAEMHVGLGAEGFHQFDVDP